MEFCQDGALSYVFSGEWPTLCRARKLMEGTNIKLGVTNASNNNVVYMCAPPMLVLRTRVPVSSSTSGDASSYHVEQCLWTN